MLAGRASLVPVKRLSRRPGEIETLNFHAAVDVPRPGERRLVSDPARVEATVAQFEAGLRDSLEKSARVRGWVSDQLFGLIAADLGGCLLVKQEDTGVLFHEDEVKLPDWRLTLAGGKHVLVEVKSVEGESKGLAKLRPSEVARLNRYAELNGLPLYVAVHWVSYAVWTLVPLDDFVRVGDHFELETATAFKRNHMSLLLNDRLLGLVPPLEFRMTMQQQGEVVEEPVSDSTEDEMTTQVSLVVEKVQMFAAGQEMLEARERSLVWFLIQHGTWPCEENFREVAGGVWEMVFTMAPEEVPPGQGFAFIGTLSEMYTRMFYSGTTSLEEGTTQLSIDVEPGTLPRLVPTDLKSERLPLWHVHQSPAGAEPPAGKPEE